MIRHRTTPLIGTVLTALLLGTGCAELQKNMKNPHPLENHFGHVLFNDSRGHFPALTPAAPQEARTPRREAEGERRPLATPEDANRLEQIHPGEQPAVAEAPTGPAGEMPTAEAPGLPPHERPLAESPVAEAPAAIESPVAETPASAELPRVPPRPPAPATTAPGALQIEEVPEEQPAAPPAGLGDGSMSSEMLAAAQRLVGMDTNYDERGFLTHLLQVAAVELTPADGEDLVKALYSRLNGQERVYGPAEAPRTGDVVFFHNTYDRDRDNRADDWFTMAAVVERTDGDGTVHFIGFARGQVRRLVMNLDRPAVRRNESTSQEMNSLLRTKSLSDRPFTAYLAGELFASYGKMQ